MSFLENGGDNLSCVVLGLLLAPFVEMSALHAPELFGFLVSGLLHLREDPQLFETRRKFVPVGTSEAVAGGTTPSSGDLVRQEFGLKHPSHCRSDLERVAGDGSSTTVRHHGLLRSGFSGLTGISTSSLFLCLFVCSGISSVIIFDKIGDGISGTLGLLGLEFHFSLLLPH